MKNTIKRIAVCIMLMLLVLFIGISTIIFFPQPLFANKLVYRNFSVYSNESIDQERTTVVLDNALELVKSSELYDPAYRYDLFLSYNSFYNKIDDLVLGQGPSARATDNNVVIKVRVDAGSDTFFPTFYHECEGSLSYLIAHEMIHCLQAYKYGKLKFNPFRHPELWKLEGYPEYVARRAKLKESGYKLRKGSEGYLDGC